MEFLFILFLAAVAVTHGVNGLLVTGTVIAYLVYRGQ